MQSQLLLAVLVVFVTFLTTAGGSPAYIRDSSVSYNEKMSYRYSYLAAAAYGDDNNVLAWNCTACRSVPDIKVYGTSFHAPTYSFGYVARDDEYRRIVIGFRGTKWDHIETLITDLKSAVATNYTWVSGAKAGLGFVQYLNNVLPGMTSILEHVLAQPDVKGYGFVAVGHSLGGAVAALAVPSLLKGHEANTILLTYGQPRTGNSVFDKYLETNCEAVWRVTHANDLVVHLPWKSASFAHSGREVYYPAASTGSYIECPTGEDKKCAQSRSGTSTKDHLDYMGIQISKLKEMA